jgi:hypothetical protein
MAVGGSKRSSTAAGSERESHHRGPARVDASTGALIQRPSHAVRSGRLRYSLNGVTPRLAVSLATPVRTGAGRSQVADLWAVRRIPAWRPVGGVSRVPSRSARAQLAATAPAQCSLAERADGRRIADALVSVERQAHARSERSRTRPRHRAIRPRSVRQEEALSSIVAVGSVTDVSLFGATAAARNQPGDPCVSPIRTDAAPVRLATS